MDIKEKRKLDLFHFVVDFSFGSLWHIKESFWARTIPGFRPKRKWHPGLSIYNGSADILIPHIPMLLGTSRSALAHYGFAVKGITESHGEDYKTWFGTVEKPVARCTPDDFFGSKPEVSRNSHKPFLTEEEMKAAKALLNPEHGGEF